MRLIEIINYKKFTLISIFLFLYLILNLLDGERGLISYYNKLELKNELILKKKMMAMELNYIEKKNNLLKLKKLLTEKNFILFVKKLAVQIFQNVGVKSMPHL